jgi:diadenosine tetraphosphate (Ap4A) HIT family hydrolase
MAEDYCIFCINDVTTGTPDVSPERILHAYDHWWLVLQPPKKRERTVQAAGMLILKRHAISPSNCRPEEFADIPAILHDASNRLCRAVGAEYDGQTRLGFNEGPEAGQTVMHTHLHLLPVSDSDPAELKVRGGIGGAFEALRTLRLDHHQPNERTTS